MRLVPELAKKIINEVRTVLTEHIIVVDSEGIIIASTDQSRVGTTHEGAKKVFQSKEKLYITHHMSVKLQGVKPGINLPIIFDSEVIGVIGITGNPTEIEPFAEIIRRMTELIIKEANYIEKKEWETRGLESFVYEWVYSNEVDDIFINRGAILGITVDLPYQCVLFQINNHLQKEEIQQNENYMKIWFDTHFPKGRDDILIRWGQAQLLLVKSRKNNITDSSLGYELQRWQKEMKKKYQVEIAIGIGKTNQAKTISQSYKQAEKALKVSEKNLQVVFYESLLLAIILEEVSDTTKDEYHHRVLSSIKADNELLRTLKTYLEHNQSLKLTAEALHCHINTLHYRLTQINNLTGIDPKSSEGIALFYVALFFNSGNTA
ncbi:CdaR family transcriptional regulator [Radiobacillus sp. PE A8.2]|uniref:CdaR family transcriptional regulator n=1 Tax=Radiobacillus sp. PE A8.2 TaxID=3380349 RepID=UPI00388EA2FB